MPKSATSLLGKMKSYVNEFPQEFQGTPRGELHCKLCGTVVTHARRSSVVKHREGVKHREKLAGATKQSVLKAQCLPIGEQLVDRVTKAFLSADIPLKKLNNAEIQGLFKFMGQKAPSESSCRQRVISLGDLEVNRVCELLTGKDLFMVVDESDVGGRKFINALVGDTRNPTKVYLISCKVSFILTVTGVLYCLSFQGVNSF